MLLQDLQDRGLLESTLVWCSGEFGRSPKVDWQPPWNGGRNHHGNVFSVLVAGGGFKGGHVVGASDAKAEEVKERPVYPVDLLGSIYSWPASMPTPSCPIPWAWRPTCCPSAAEGVKSAGLLDGDHVASPWRPVERARLLCDRLNWPAVLGVYRLAGVRVRSPGQVRPYIGFVYPAGGQQGTTFQVKLGGQGWRTSTGPSSPARA